MNKPDSQTKPSKRYATSNQEMKTTKEQLEKLGIKEVPSDHPIYKTGPTIHIFSKRPKILKKEKKDE